MTKKFTITEWTVCRDYTQLNTCVYRRPGNDMTCNGRISVIQAAKLLLG